MTTNWNRLSNQRSLSEQSRRERNGSKHRETMSINAEIVGDNGVEKRRRTKPMNFEQINQAVIKNREIAQYSDLRMKFGPRLVMPDGTARYRV